MFVYRKESYNVWLLVESNANVTWNIWWQIPDIRSKIILGCNFHILVVQKARCFGAMLSAATKYIILMIVDLLCVVEMEEIWRMV